MKLPSPPLPTSAAALANLRRHRRLSRGFTLVELVLVLTILAVLMGAAIYQLNKGGFFDTAVDQRIESDIKTIGISLDAYRIGAGRFPTTEQGLAKLTEQPSPSREPFLKEIPMDPWKQPYKYRQPGTKSRDGYDIYSVGKDGQENTEDDVGNWKPAEPK